MSAAMSVSEAVLSEAAEHGVYGSGGQLHGMFGGQILFQLILDDERNYAVENSAHHWEGLFW